MDLKWQLACACLFVASCGGEVTDRSGVTSTGGLAAAGGASGGGSVGGSAKGGSTATSTKPVLATDGGIVFDEAGSIPIDVQTLANDVRQASDVAQSAGGPLVCSVMIPSVQIAADTDIARAVTAYASGVVGVPESDITSTQQECGDAMWAPCANIFQNDLAHLGGQMANTTYATAQRIETQATNVRIFILTPVQDGLALSVIVVLAGVQNGWLVSVATFADRLQCG